MDNKSKLVSVIVPVFNAKKYLLDCIKSLLSNDYKNLELIFVDDGSTDGSLEILKKYKKDDSRINIISQKNLGAGAARNRGIDAAKGDYLMFVDADDILCPDSISKSISLALLNDEDIVMFNYDEIDDNYSLGNISKTNFVTQFDLERWGYNEFWDNYFNKNLVWCVAPWGKLFKRKIFEKIRFKNRFYEDEYLLNDLIKKNVKILVFNEILYLYRKHSESTMAKPFSKRYLDKVDCFLERTEQFYNDQSRFAAQSSMMIIHACNILKRHIKIVGRNEYKNKLQRSKRILSKVLKINIGANYRGRIIKFLKFTNLYYFLHYSTFLAKAKRIISIPRKFLLYIQIKKSMKIISNYMENGYYLYKDGNLTFTNKPSRIKCNVFKLNTNHKEDELYKSGKIIRTKYKTILITKRKSIYFLKRKKRYFQSKTNILKYCSSSLYPILKLDFDDCNLRIIGNTVLGKKYKRNEKFNTIVSNLFDIYKRSEYKLTDFDFGNNKFVIPYCIQHGDLKDSNIIWLDDSKFCLIDLEAFGLKPIFFDLFFFIFISKKEKADLTLFSKPFYESFKNVLEHINIKFKSKNEMIDSALFYYLIFLLNDYKEEHTKNYYNYYLTNIINLVEKYSDILPQCKNAIKTL